jgi:hypothetical protein
VTVPVLLDLLLCHSRAWLPREESRSFPTFSSGIRPRAPDTRAGMTEKFDRADVRVTILCRIQIVGSALKIADFARARARRRVCLFAFGVAGVVEVHLRQPILAKFPKL